ncbi:fructose-bisphosphate aldolase, partial [Burkholderia multivorans]
PPGVLPVPLVLHGSAGVTNAEIRRGIAAGMRKINVSTHLNAVFTAAVRETLVEHPDLVDSRKFLAPAREAFAAEVARLLALFAGETDAPTAREPDAPAAGEAAAPADGERTASRTQESEA